MPPRSKTKKEVLSPLTTTAYRIADLSNGLFLVRPDSSLTPEGHLSWGSLGSLFSSPDEAASHARGRFAKISPLWCIQEITISVSSSFSIPPP